MTEAYTFRVRECCPVCKGPLDQLASLRFGEEPMLGYLSYRYSADASVLRDASYSIARCRTCTLLCQVEVGDDAFLEELYTNWVEEPENPDDYPAYRRDLADMPASRDAHEIVAAASFLRLELPQMKTLDCGMGWALWARISKWLGCQSWGFDLSAIRMEFAADQGIDCFSFDDAEHEGSFHFINCEQVFEHLVDPGEEAERLAKFLAPGGILKVSVPSAERFDPSKVDRWIVERHREKLMPLQPLEHVNGFTRRAINALAERAGLELVRPGLLQRYAFLRMPGSIRLSNPRQSLKELARPIVQYHRPSNLYEWLQRPLD